MRTPKPTMKRPVRQDMICYKGQSWNRNLRFKVGAQRTTKDMTGWTAKAEIRPAENSDTLSAEIHVGVTEIEGMISLGLLPEQTAALWPDVYAWDLYTIEPNGEKKYWMKGKFYVDGRVTV